MGARPHPRATHTRPLPRRAFRRLEVERLAKRSLCAVSALSLAQPLNFGAFNVAEVTHDLSAPGEIDYYSATLRVGDILNASIDTQQFGGSLASLLRIYNANGVPLTTNGQQGGDPHLSFQAATAGLYYIGVSGGTDGGTTGLYTLSVQHATSVSLQPDLSGASFRLGADMGAAGDSIPVSFIVQNGGGADPGKFQVEVVLSRDENFEGSLQVLTTLSRSELTPDTTGRNFSSPSGFHITLPNGLASGNAYVGLRIIADPTVPEAGLYDKNGVHRGLDWEPLTVDTRTPVGVTDLSQADAGLNTETLGAVGGSEQVGTYTFTVSTTQGSGNFRAEVTTTSGTLIPRLTLSGQLGQILIQSDSGNLLQNLVPGVYLLTVSAQTGLGNYRLTTTFQTGSVLYAPLAAGTGTAWVVTADVNNDGIPDVITGNRIDNTVSIFLGNGNGTFAPPESFDIGARVWRITVADVNNDGRPDILTANKGENTVGVLLGNGDGTFQAMKVYPVGTRPGGVTVADVNGDGKPDLVVSNYASDTIGILLGNGDGTFQPQQTYPTNNGPGFAGPGPAAVADVNGDGIPDLIYPNYIGANVAVRLGKGDGTFGAQETFPAGKGSYSVKVLDVNGDGIPDIVDANAVDNSVSVLLGNGNGAFQTQKVYPVGFDPYSMTVADLNGDGRPDIVTSNRGDNTVSVLLSNGDGTFQGQEVFPTGKFPRAVAVADLNSDGKPDIVTANQGDNSVSVLLGNGDGTFSFGVQQSAPAPNLRPFQVTVADVNGDGIPDIITANRSDNSVSVLLGNPDGSFQTKETFAAGRLPISVAVADLNGDGKPDIVTANYGGNTVSVLLGNGDGTFQPHIDLVAGSDPYDVKVADLNGDGKPDLVVTNKNDNTVGVLLGNGNGTFQPMQAFPVASGPYEVVVKDVDGNGIPDLIVSHFSASVVDVLLGNGDGTFQPSRTFATDGRPYGLAVADVNGDGKPDIITANYHNSTVSVLLNEGGGNFGSAMNNPVGKAPNEVQVADLNGDGKPDIITANYGSNNVSVLLGNGDGTFRPQQTFSAGIGPASVEVADLNRDGKLDLVVGNRNNSTVNLLLGNGNGTFQAPIPLGAGKNRYSAAIADVNGDGTPDVITTNVRQDTVSILLGNGDGTFQAGQTVAVGAAPTSVVVADLNGDGRPDLITTNSDDNTVSVLLGNGDGTFSVQQTFAVGRSPRAVKVADVNGDGIPDLVVANYDDNTVSVLIGEGDGAFDPQKVYTVGAKPYALTAADLNGDGKPDIIVANSGTDTASVLLGNGDGTFQPQQTFATGRQPMSVAVADLNGDGKPDIVTANTYDNTVSVLLGNGDGTFQPQQAFAVGSRPYSVALADLNGDGRPDIVTANYGSSNVSVLINTGAGGFRPQQNFATDTTPVQTLVTDVNGDGRPDLITVSNHDSAIGILLGKGNGSFSPATAASGVALSDTPFLADLNGDGVLDSIVLDRSGDILFRKGMPGATNAFAPPVILNPGRPARVITVLRMGSQFAVAAADAHFDPTLSSSQFVFTVSIYTVDQNGTTARRTAFSTTALPTSLTAADLTGNGLDDLIAANALDNSVSIVLQNAPGLFGFPISVPTGIAPSDIAVADLNGDGLPDVVVTDQASGDVTVVLNNPDHTFGESLRFRASTNPYSVDTTSTGTVLSSSVRSVSLVAGDFTGDGRNDLVVVNQGTHSFTLLQSNGNSGFADPQPGLTTSTSDGLNINERPGAIVAGDFNRDGLLDLALLMEDTGQLWIYSGNGNGTFRHTFSIPVGDQATGLSVVPGNSPGLLNLLVGNGFGDVLTLEGKGDGTFQIQGSRVSLSVVPNLLGPGQAGVLVGNQQDNRVTVQAPSANGQQYAPVQTLDTSTSSGQLAPGDVQWAVLDQGATLPDAVVVSTGSNAVVVYRTTAVTNGVPSFGASPRTYFVGTAPVSVTVADINDDGIPDMLVANQGSNDVSVIFGSYDTSGDWVGIPGPRLKSGGDGPIAIIVRDLNADGIPDLAVINGGSGTVTMLPGVGRGFFDDRKPEKLFNLGSAVSQPPTFVGNTGVGYAVTAMGALIRFDLDHPNTGSRIVFSSQQVVAAQALPTGQVVVAIADGSVKLLAPVGDNLNVAYVLQAQGGVPALPSAINVVYRASGKFDVLVSSQGSDTIYVFAQNAGSTTTGASPIGSVVTPTPSPFGAFQAVTITVSQFIAVSAGESVAGAFQSAVSASSSSSTTSSSASVVVTSTVGLSLGTFSSVGKNLSRGNSSAMLVPVAGNNYISVPLLDFGSEREEEADDGARHMLRLWKLFSIGDASDLTRFVMGIDEALQAYRGGLGEVPAAEHAEPANDPWNEDLFFRRQPASPQNGQETNGTTENVGEAAARLDSKSRSSLTDPKLSDDRPQDDPGFLALALRTRLGTGLKLLSGFFAGMLLTTLTVGRNAGDRERPGSLIPTQPIRRRDSLLD